MTDPRHRVPVRRRAAAWTLLVLLAGCGFHLRGTGKVVWPAALSSMRVVVQGSSLANDPLRRAMESALMLQAGVHIVTQGAVPVLVLFGGQTTTQVLSVSNVGMANEYLVRYQLSFRLNDAAGRPLAAPQLITLSRAYSFDPLALLAMSREQQELQANMQRDAVEQILRRLAPLKLPMPVPAAHAPVPAAH